MPAGGNITFTGIPYNTLATITAQTSVEMCYLDYWLIDGVQKPDPQDQTIFMSIKRDRTVTAVCSTRIYQIDLY